jgi:hypothetical protein
VSAPAKASTPGADAAARERVLRVARRAGIEDLALKVVAGERLSRADGARLYRADLHAVGELANHARERLHGDRAYFNVNQHVNYTNICNKLCRFCAFQRLPNQQGAYWMTPEQVEAKIRAQLASPVTEVHMVAGIHPKLDYQYYLDILRAAKRARPSTSRPSPWSSSTRSPRRRGSRWRRCCPSSLRRAWVRAPAAARRSSPTACTRRATT